MTDTIKAVAEASYFEALSKADKEYGTLSHRDFTVGYKAAINAMQIREMTMKELAEHLKQDFYHYRTYAVAKSLAKLGTIRIVGEV